jgi:hypothetical protein
MPAKPKKKSTPTPKTAKNPRGAGRRPTPIDYNEVYKLAGIQATDEEIAAWIGMTAEGFRKRKLKDKELQDIMFRGRGKGRASLRRSQWTLAQAGNATMNIWLGKQMLGQRDKQDISQEINVTDVRDMTEDQLLKIASGKK